MLETKAKRNPQLTRERLLGAAFLEIYHSGYQGADLGNILLRAEVTKGALYHHFDSKEALGYAVVDEIIAKVTRDKWLDPLAQAADPLAALIRIVQSTSLSDADVRGGCPLNNLAQEMSPLDEGFRARLAALFLAWRTAIAHALKAGQKQGQVQPGIDPMDTATFLVATYEGYISLAKNSQDPRILQAGKKRLTRYLESLRVS